VNLQTVYLPQRELLQFIDIQQSVVEHLGMQLQLVDGMFVLVASAQLQPSEIKQAGFSGSSSSSRSAVAAAIPWRLRQILSVEVAAGDDPADATVVLVRGDRVRAGAVHEAQLAEVLDHEVRGGYQGVIYLLFLFILFCLLFAICCILFYLLFVIYICYAGRMSFE
jgi:hypothetical protein